MTMAEEPRFIDNGNGTITDHALQVMWKKVDSLQETGKWKSWLKCNDYIEIANLTRFAGFEDWRFPTEEEAFSLFDLTKTSKDKFGDDIYLDPIFEPGSAGTTWTSATRESAALIVQYEDGGRVWPSQYANLSMAVRLVRSLSK
jgi:hypothetical protein